LSLVDNQRVEIKSNYDTITYPIIDTGDDLTKNQTGTARFVLYQFQVDNGVISNITTKFKSIRYNNRLFDIIISNQSEFDELVASSNWLGATSVAFVGDGGDLKFTLNTLNNSGIKIPQTVKEIIGFNNAIIEVT